MREFIVTSCASGGFVQETAAAEIPNAAAAVKFGGDPTGAGDLFLAAYVVKRLLKQHSISDACQYSAKLAASQIEENHITAYDLCIRKPPAHSSFWSWRPKR